MVPFGIAFTQAISKTRSVHFEGLYLTMPQPSRQARPNTRAMASNPTPGTRPPSSSRSQSRQRSAEAGGPFDFMAKVPSPVVPPPTAPEASAAGLAVTVHDIISLIC